MFNITKKMLKKMDIQTEDDLKNYELNFFEIIGIVENLYHIRSKGPVDFKSFCNIIKDDYGTFTLFTYLYSLLTLNRYEEFGVYDYLYQNELLSSRYGTTSDGYLDTDILRDISDIFTDLLNTEVFFQKFDIKELVEHFKNINIKIDKRDFITINHNEYAKMFEVLNDKLLGTEIEFDDSSRINFNNTRVDEIYNIEHIEVYNDELSRILLKLDISDFIYINFNELFNNIVEGTMININLFVCCSSEDIPKRSVGHGDVKYFSDMQGHPKYVLEEFKKTFARAQKEGTQELIVETDLSYIVDYIKYLMYKREINLHKDIFKYRDNNNKLHELSITKEGKFEPKFPSGFYDITIQEIFEINKDGKND